MGVSDETRAPRSSNLRLFRESFEDGDGLSSSIWTCSKTHTTASEPTLCQQPCVFCRGLRISFRGLQLYHVAHCCYFGWCWLPELPLCARHERHQRVHCLLLPRPQSVGSTQRTVPRASGQGRR